MNKMINEMLKRMPLFLGVLLSILPVAVLGDIASPPPPPFPFSHPSLPALWCSPYGRSLLYWMPLMATLGILVFICRESPRWKNIGLLDVIIEICIFIELLVFFTNAADAAFAILMVFSFLQVVLVICSAWRWVWLKFDKRCGWLTLRRFLVLAQLLLGLVLTMLKMPDMTSWQQDHCTRCGAKKEYHFYRRCMQCDPPESAQEAHRNQEGWRDDAVNNFTL